TMMRKLDWWVGPVAAVAGLLWGAQGLIWTLGPKVQAADPPYGVINRPLFALFWLAIAGATLCSAVALLGLQRGQRAGAGMACRAGRPPCPRRWPSLPCSPSGRSSPAGRTRWPV